jgi:hypothetical protein
MLCPQPYDRQFVYPALNNYLPLLALYTLDILIYQKHQE